MLHVLEQSQLPVGPPGMNQGLERSGKLFDCHLLSGFGIACRTATDENVEIKIVDQVYIYKGLEDSERTQNTAFELSLRTR